MNRTLEQPRPQPTDDGRERSKYGGRLDWSEHRALRARAASWGALAGSLLVGLYAGTLALTNSLEHLVEEFLRLWFLMTPLVLGFSLQVGLFAYARRASRAGRAPAHAHGIVASGGASTVSMVACCAHHLAEALPLIGLAGAATLLVAYQNLFLLLGILSNLVGLVYVLGLLRRMGRFPARTSLLSLALRWRVDRALGPAFALALIIFITVLVAGRTTWT
jgi:hypothetical protein